MKKWGVDDIKEYAEENYGEEVAQKLVCELAVLNETAKKSCNLSLHCQVEDVYTHAIIRLVWLRTYLHR